MIERLWYGLRDSLRLWLAPERMRAEGTTPDYRFSLANERTFLAWVRTALALVAGGLAADQFLTGMRAAPRTAIAVVLLAGGALCAVRAVNHWLRTERAMRRGEDLPLSRFPVLLALGTAVTALAVVAGVVLGELGR
ncbi:YidH family protein [Streptomyces nanhaiensis]|uniref:YidH family protein n=1 Tax=Streptomyces nanhaiensis TaxID=679319 RepID=UPI00399CC768